MKRPPDIAADRPASLAESRRLALRPGTPPAAVRGLLERLGWRDLADVSLTATAHPTTRRRAESLLLLRIDGLSVGERVSLARRSGQRVIDVLLESVEEPVLRAALDNQRLSEDRAVRLAGAPGLPGSFLEEFAGHPEWGCRKDVRLAIAGNPRTPVATALRLLGLLSRGDLKRLVNDDKVPTIVRVSASRNLDHGAESSPRARASSG